MHHGALFWQTARAGTIFDFFVVELSLNSNNKKKKEKEKCFKFGIVAQKFFHHLPPHYFGKLNYLRHYTPSFETKEILIVPKKIIFSNIFG